MPITKKGWVLPTEEREQMTVVQWLEYNNYKFTAIPNSTWTPSRNQKMKNKRVGLRPGLPDMLIILKNKRLLFLEMKREKGGTVSPEQRIWIGSLKNCGVYADVAHGADQAFEIIKKLDI